MKYINKILNIIKKTIEILIAITFIIMEEIVWEYLVKPIKVFLDKKIKPHAQEYIKNSNPYYILGVFVLMFAMAEGLGIFAGFLFIKGLLFASLTVYIIKVVIAGVAFWVFKLTKEKLLSIHWFDIVYKKTLVSINWIKTRELYLNIRAKSKAIILALKQSGEFDEIYYAIKKIFRDKNKEE